MLLAQGKIEAAQADVIEAMTVFAGLVGARGSSAYLGDAAMLQGRIAVAQQGSLAAGRAAFLDVAGHFQSNLGAEHFKTKEALRLARLPT